MAPRKRKAGNDEPRNEEEQQSSPPKKARKQSASRTADSEQSTRPKRGSTVTDKELARGKRKGQRSAAAPQPTEESQKKSAKKVNEKTDTATSTKATIKTGAKKSKPNGKKPSDGTSTNATINRTETDEEKDVVDGDKARGGSSYWLMKAEPESRIVKGKDVAFSIEHLRAATEPEPWDGVRNPVGMLEILPQSAARTECTGKLTKIARNNMRAMKKGDLAFFYHSNCKKPGIVGIMEIVQEHSVDESAFDPNHPYYDGKSTRENPKWIVVRVEFRRKFDEIISLDKLKTFAKSGGALENLQTLRMSRLSVSAVTPNEWDFILDQVQSQNEDDE